MMHAWKVGDERAETYLRLRAEAELRRVSTELRRADAASRCQPAVRQFVNPRCGSPHQVDVG